ncbi:ABC transporter permease [Priestia endophytica]|uniref:ABC transporter permease n=1 Tax=Priestia endophytica TaxID=135735 RepID=UPI003D28C88D
MKIMKKIKFYHNFSKENRPKLRGIQELKPFRLQINTIFHPKETNLNTFVKKLKDGCIYYIVIDTLNFYGIKKKEVIIMLIGQLYLEFKRAFTTKNILSWLCIVVLLPLICFFPVMQGYIFFSPVEVFQEILGGIMPLIFPVLIIIIYLPDFWQEQRNNFITYTRPRIPLNEYILSKGLINAVFTGGIIFLMLFFSYTLVEFIEPHFLQFIKYETPSEYNQPSNVTFSQFLKYGDLTYFLIYSLWVTLNAIVYTTISFLLMLIIRHPFIALSVPFLFYHIFNFIAGIFGVAKFSPLSTIFPFNIEQQSLWTIMIPFTFLLLILSILYFIVIRKKEEWMI